MFTGLITHRAKINAVEALPEGGATLKMSNPFPDSDPPVDGESIAVNGCCLTVLAKQGSDSNTAPKNLLFFVSEETLSLTTLRKIKTSATVNLERALKLGDRFGGHVVSGHIDCLGQITEAKPNAGSTLIRVSYPATHSALVIPKGSVTIDGVSLTINTLIDETADTDSTTTKSFTINIIPHTNEQTNFAALSVGENVNLEFDMFAKFALRNAELRASGENINPAKHNEIESIISFAE